jgi:hypothetical protein
MPTRLPARSPSSCHSPGGNLYNWSQDLETALWNAGLDDREILLAGIGFCEEALRRFPREDQLMTENRRRTLAESHFEAGMTERAAELFGSWLADDPSWGVGLDRLGGLLPPSRREARELRPGRGASPPRILGP